MPVSLELPVVQKWSCHSCAGCCRQHLVEITDDERVRIQKQGWVASGEIGDRGPVVPLSRWSKRWRLNHAPDGACVFLNDEGLCRIHAKFGEAAKPLACRVYPYAFHPAGGGKIAVSFRYSCPSVVANRGAPPEEAAASIRQIAGEVVPSELRDIPPPGVTAKERLDWKSVRRIVRHLEASFAESNEPFLRTLLGTIFWVSLVDQAQFDKLQGGRLEEFLSLIRPASSGEVPADLGEFSEPTRAGRLMFRAAVGQYARHETAADLDHPWQARLRNVKGIYTLSRSTGTLPEVRPELKPVAFEQLERPFGWPAGADELFSRYMQTKIRGMHFCGAACYDMPLTEGFFALALVAPVTFYIARWLAAGEERHTLQSGDIEQALAIVDHHHGFSPALGGQSARRRVRMLAGGDLAKLCVYYGR